MKAVYPILVLLAMTSCLQEELSPENYVFRGGWDSPKYAIQIYANGSGVLDIRNRGRCEGNVWIRGDKMTFMSENENDAIGYKRFHIDQRPTTDANGVTYMILDGHRLERVW